MLIAITLLLVCISIFYLSSINQDRSTITDRKRTAITADRRMVYFTDTNLRKIKPKAAEDKETIHSDSLKIIEKARRLYDYLHECRCETEGKSLILRAVAVSNDLKASADALKSKILPTYNRASDISRLSRKLNEMEFLAEELLRAVENPVRFRRREDGNYDPFRDCPQHPTQFQVKIVYNADKKITERVVDVEHIIIRGDDVYIRGLCHLADNDRTFHCGRIISLIDMETGEIIEKDIPERVRQRISGQKCGTTEAGPLSY